MMTVTAGAVSCGRKCCRRGLQGRVISDCEPPIVRHILCLAVFQSRATIPSRLAISCLLLLCATSQPFLTQSAKLTLVSNHEQLLFFGDRRQKMILGGE